MVTDTQAVNHHYEWNTMPSSKIPMDHDDQKSTDGMGTYQILLRHSALFRIVLWRSFCTQIMLGQWYRLDLELVSELGLALKGEKAQSCWMRLTCDVLVKQRKGNTVQIIPDSSKQIEIRAIPDDAWETSIESPGATEFPGFQHSGRGGFEFRISDLQQVVPYGLGDSQQSTKTKYFLYIAPTLDPTQTVHALPLVIGPLNIQCSHANGRADKSVNCLEEGTWDTDVRSNDMYRAYALDYRHLPALRHSTFFVVKEGWSLGTSGKIWDSAIVMSDMMMKKIYQEPTCLQHRHIIDLSAGIGCVGLLLGFVCEQLNIPNVHITLTDLPDALNMILYNQKLNFGRGQPPSNITIRKLRWGSVHDARRVLQNGVADVILVSDVLYNTAHFTYVIQTLEHLSTYGRTVIYLGFKKRGLKDEDEARFFQMASLVFDISPVEQNKSWPNPVAWEQQHGFLNKDSGGSMDGRSWLGHKALEHPNITITGAKEAAVHVYRLVRKKPESAPS